MADRVPGWHDSDFELDTWDIYCRRRGKPDLYDKPEQNHLAQWEEFEAVGGPGRKELDGRVVVVPYETTLPSGEKRLGMTVRAFDPTTGLWSFAWPDNFHQHDFTPLTGRFLNSIGVFEHEIRTTDGRPLRERFTWTIISEDKRRWEQAFSLDDGATWDVNWIMEHTRRPKT